MKNPLRFDLKELAGAIGDYGTLLPIVVGVVVVTRMPLSPILFFFGLSYILTGLYYRLPIPVEPMKVIGAIAIGGSLTKGEIAGAGIITGLILLGLGLFGGMNQIKKVVPISIIRGIQLVLALTFFQTAFTFIQVDPILGLISLAIVSAFTLLPVLDISSLLLFTLGILVGLYHHGAPGFYQFQWPFLSLPSLPELGRGFLAGALPQIPLTLGNSILATSLLVADLFKEKVPEGRLAKSVGLMCLLSSPFGGLPMCHGAGGLAAQYRFGARTGGSNILSGGILLVVAFFFASKEVIQLLPYGVLGALLFFSGLQLLKSAAKTNDYWITLLTGFLGFFHLAAAFLAMLILYWSREKIKKNTPSKPTP